MSNIVFLIEASSVEEFFVQLNQRVAPEELTKFLLEVKGMLQEHADTHFKTESDGIAQWVPLAEATNQIREDLGYPREHPINVRSGELKKFLVDGGSVSTLPDGALLLYPDEATGILAEKYETAQRGSTKTGAPPRRVFNFDTQDAELVIMALMGHLTGGPL